MGWGMREGWERSRGEWERGRVGDKEGGEDECGVEEGEGQRVSVEWRMGGEGWRMGNRVKEDEGGRWWWSIGGANISKMWAVHNGS